jgi:hypothetical protein
MIEITVNDRLGKKVRVKCNEDDTIGDLKKLVAAQTGTRSVISPIKYDRFTFRQRAMFGQPPLVRRCNGTYYRRAKLFGSGLAKKFSLGK